jgi:spore maturation protein CgeB
MGHVTTWPDVYIPYETYVPLAWDGSDLLTQTQRYLEDGGERRRIAAHAFEVYQKALSELPDRFDTLVGEFFP